MVGSYTFVLSFTLLFALVTILFTSLNQPRLIGTDWHASAGRWMINQVVIIHIGSDLTIGYNKNVGGCEVALSFYSTVAKTHRIGLES